MLPKKSPPPDATCLHGIEIVKRGMVTQKRCFIIFIMATEIKRIRLDLVPRSTIGFSFLCTCIYLYKIAFFHVEVLLVTTGSFADSNKTC